MEQIFSMQGIEPVFVKKGNSSVVVLSEEEYAKIVFGYEQLQLYQKLQQAKANRASGKTKYHSLEDVSKEWKKKYGF